jgi:hypothetical protein
MPHSPTLFASCCAHYPGGIASNVGPRKRPEASDWVSVGKTAIWGPV